MALTSSSDPVLEKSSPECVPFVAAVSVESVLVEVVVVVVVGVVDGITLGVGDGVMKGVVIGIMAGVLIAVGEDYCLVGAMVGGGDGEDVGIPAYLGENLQNVK